jgi:hypothetical protein
MSTNLERFRADLTKLIRLGDDMYLDLTLRTLAERKAQKKEHGEEAKRVKGCFEKAISAGTPRRHRLSSNSCPIDLMAFVGPLMT